MRIVAWFFLPVALLGCSGEQAPETKPGIGPVSLESNRAEDSSQSSKVVLTAAILSSEVDSALVLLSSNGKELPCQEEDTTQIRILSPDKYVGEAYIYHPSSTVDERWISKGRVHSIRMLDQQTLDSWAESKDDKERNVVLPSTLFEFLPNKKRKAPR